jgi:hypothetical protein
VTLNNILAINNLQNGAYVDNCDWNDDPEVNACNGNGNVSILGTLGDNTFSDNGATGLAVYSNGAITVDKVFAIQNKGRGMVLSNETGSAPITISNTVTRLNQWHGLHLITNGLVTLRNTHSMSNGVGLDGAGIFVRAYTASSLKFYLSSFIGNEGSGIEIAYDTALLPVLSGVSYFGNDTDRDGDLNLEIYLAP